MSFIPSTGPDRTRTIDNQTGPDFYNRAGQQQQLDRTRPKAVFVAAKTVFAAVKTVFVLAQTVFAAAESVFPAAETIFAAPKTVSMP